MKRKVTTIGLACAVLFFTGCEVEEKIDKRMDKITNSLETLVEASKKSSSTTATKGFSCDNKEVLTILKRIVDRKFNGDFEVEKENIVIWDYNNVGRYTCKAKIKKVGEQKNNTSSRKNDNELIYSMLGEMLAPAQYGISKDGGWVNYYTYVTTTSDMYVELFTRVENNE